MGYSTTRRAAAVIAAAAMLSAAAVATFAAGQRAGLARAERAAAEAEDLERWRRAFVEERAKLDATSAAVDDARGDLASKLARLQAELIRLDSLGQRLAARAELEGTPIAGFDFRVEPPLGGPEEPDAAGQARGAELRLAAQQLAASLEQRSLMFGVLDDLLRWRKLESEGRPDGRPVAVGYVSSRFGRRIDPFTGQMAAHRGVDFAGPLGSEIVAVASGLVVWSGPRHGYGEVVEIDHGQGHVTRYAHNAENLVQVGDVVTRGQTIARLGATGRATGPNLHFEVLRDGRAVNPLSYMD